MESLKQLAGVNIDTLYEKRYGKQVAFLGYEEVKKCIPFSIEELKNSIDEGDTAFNKLPISTWDRSAGFTDKSGRITQFESALTSLIRSKGADRPAPSQCVCLLKECAREWVEEEKIKNMILDAVEPNVGVGADGTPDVNVLLELTDKGYDYFMEKFGFLQEIKGELMSLITWSQDDGMENTIINCNTFSQLREAIDISANVYVLFQKDKTDIEVTATSCDFEICCDATFGDNLETEKRFIRSRCEELLKKQGMDLDKLIVESEEYIKELEEERD